MGGREPSHDFSGHELSSLEAHVVVELLRDGSVHPSELIEISLDRIDAVDSAVNAMPTVCGDRARRFVSSLGAPDDEAGWLGGLPVGIKDLTAVAGVRTTQGTMALADFVPDESAPLVLQIESRGGAVVGKTNTPEMGAGANTFNEVFGMTRNPWNTSRNAGGSSGGAAASLATGQVWLSHGSDLAGSLRTPAAYCGVVGFRPTPGRVITGARDLDFELEAVPGPMARSVLDCALFLDTMSGYDPRSPISFPPPEERFIETTRRDLVTLRIAFSPDLGGLSPCSAEMEEHLRRALSAVEGSGADVVEDCPPLPDLDRTYRVLRAMHWAATTGRLPADIQAGFKRTLTDNIEVGRRLSIDDVYEAHLGRSVIYQHMVTFFETYDVLACPVVGLMPGRVEEEYPKEIDGAPLSDYIEWLRFSYLSPVAALPAVSVPVGLTDDGLPVGLQLIGRPRGEAQLLAAARFVEQAVGGPLPVIDPVVTHDG